MFTKTQCLVAAFSAETSNPHPEIAAVLVTPDAMAATDSYMLAEIKRRSVPSTDNFPIIEGQKPPVPLTDPLLIPADFITSLGKSIPKDTTLPILANAAFLGIENGSTAVFLTTTLENAQTHRTRLIDGKYPAYQALIPTDSPAVTITLDAFKLKACADLLSKFYKNAGGSLPTVKIEVRSPNDALVLRAGTSDHDAMLILMPIRS